MALFKRLTEEQKEAEIKSAARLLAVAVLLILFGIPLTCASAVVIMAVL